MIDREHPLSVTRQARLLEISRGAVYYQPRPTSEADLALMRRIDELHLKHPFMGARMLRRMFGYPKPTPTPAAKPAAPATAAPAKK